MIFPQPIKRKLQGKKLKTPKITIKLHADFFKPSINPSINQSINQSCLVDKDVVRFHHHYRNQSFSSLS